MEVVKFESPEELALNFARLLADRVDQSDRYTVALSGGSTPRLLFEILAADFNEVINWDHLHIFWGDERCVPPDHSESNYGVAKNILFDNLHVSPDIHRVLGEADPEQEAVRYSEEIDEVVPRQGQLPRFDLVILGMGDDGHTASIFPHQMELLTSGKICEVATHPTSGQKRITLTGPVINNASEVVFLVTGESKADRIREIHYKEEPYTSYPAAHIRPVAGSVSWHLDRAAARYLKD